MFLPLGISLSAIVLGADNGECILNPWIPSFTVATYRIDNSSINLIVIGNFSNHESAGLRAQLYPSRKPMQIKIDDMDFSNQSIIQQQGLKDTINPPEGITRYGNDTSIIMSGADITPNGSIEHHIVVTSYYEQAFPTVILDKYV
jgi:hypothetical protein